MGEASGDCGMGKRNLSYGISILFILLLVRQIFRPTFPMYRFLLFVSVLSLALWFAQLFYGVIGWRLIGGIPEMLSPYFPWGYRALLPFGLVAGVAALLCYRFGGTEASLQT